MSLPGICQWINDTAPAVALHESEIAFPVVESIHVLAIALLAGTVAILDLRLLGIVLKKEPVSQVAEQVLPLTWIGFGVMFVTGAMLFASEAVKMYTNPAFRVKLLLMVLAGLNPLIFHSTIYRSVGTWSEAARTPARARVAAVFFADTVERHHSGGKGDRLLLICRCFPFFSGSIRRRSVWRCGIRSGLSRRSRWCICWDWHFWAAWC